MDNNVASKFQGDAIESLPANSSWSKFFVSAFLGNNFCHFSGRASRREYWAVNIMWLVVSTFIGVLLLTITMATGKDVSMVDALVSLYAILPLLGLNARRFHDINMRAWWCLLILPLFFLPFFRGDKKDNRFGKTIYTENN